MILCCGSPGSDVPWKPWLPVEEGGKAWRSSAVVAHDEHEDVRSAFRKGYDGLKVEVEMVSMSRW